MDIIANNTADTLQNVRENPPYSNTGVEADNLAETTQAKSAKIHYLNLTVWQGLEDLARIARYWLSYCKEDIDDEFKFLSERGPRMARLGEYGHIREFVGQGGQNAEYVQLSLQGAACEVLDAFGIWSIMREIPGRVKGSRIDGAFDGVPFTVREFYEAVKAGELVSRSFRPDSVVWMENKEGHTCYLGSPKGMYFLRVYDRRGPVRMEFELSDDAAANVVQALSYEDYQKWGELLSSWLVKLLDFRSTGKSFRRRERSTWWKRFMEGRIMADMPRYEKPKRGSTYVGRFEVELKRMAKRLKAYGQYVGQDKFFQTLNEMAGEDVSEEIGQFTKGDFRDWKYGRFYNKGQVPF